MKIGSTDISAAYLGSTALQKVYVGSTEVWSSVDPDAQAFFDRVTTAGGSLSATEQTAVNTLVVQMKADGIWSKMKAVYPMVGASAAACAQNLKSSSFTGTFSSGWTFASTGVTPNGTSAYMDTNLSPVSELAQDSTHISTYVRTSSQGVFIGCNTTDRRLWFAPNFNGSQKYLEINTAITTTPSNSVSSSVGLWIGNRSASSSSKLYNNSSINYSHTTLSEGLPNINIYISARNLNNAANNFSSAQIALGSIGSGLTDTEASDFYTAVQAFQTTLSRQV